MGDKQGKRIGELVRKMIVELSRYDGHWKGKGQRTTRPRYTKFRSAKRELYDLRPDLARNLVRFAQSQTPWGFEAETELTEQYDPDETYDIDYWEDLADEYDEHDNGDFAHFEKFS